MKKYPKEFKKKMAEVCEESIRNGIPIASVAKKFKVNYNTLLSWKFKYINHGVPKDL